MAKKTWMTRAAGVLLPVSSLPSKYGIGNFGQAAREWVDFLVQAEQRYWQVLPLGPTSFGDSPYQSYSAFAGEPLYIDLDQLAEAGLLKKGACKRVEWGEDPSHVDYDVVRTGRKKLLRKAFKNFEDKKALEAFRQENAEWVEDYALYMALKDKNKGRPWTEWKKGLRLRDPAALEEEYASLYPLHKMGKVSDMANAVRFLSCSEDSGFITGEIMNVCGGSLI